MKAFWVALQFLTRLPSPRITYDDDTLLSRSTLFYPLVGAIIGLLLFSAVWLLGLIPSEDILTSNAQVVAAIVLIIWVSLTGALHLDGLGDSADGWLGGGDDKQRSFEIMQDPRAGTAAVVAIVMILLLKFSALAYLLSQQAIWPLLLAPVLGRMSVLGLLLTTPNARPEGFYTEVSKYLPRSEAISILFIFCALIIFSWPIAGSIVILTALGIGFLLRHLMLNRIEGATGDTCGALIEITEASCLTALCFIL